jgi:hypothetical protein
MAKRLEVKERGLDPDPLMRSFEKHNIMRMVSDTKLDNKTA